MNLFIETLKPKLHSFKESLYLLAQNKLSLLAAIVLVLIILVAAFSPYIVPYPQDISDEAHIAEKLLPPSGCAFHTCCPYAGQGRRNHRQRDGEGAGSNAPFPLHFSLSVVYCC